MVDNIGASCIVVSASTGKILFQRRAFDRLYPASCTKIATLAYILSRPDLDIDTKITVPPEAVRIVRDSEKARDNFSRYPSYVQEATGTSARFIANEIVTIRDALYGMMLVSGNDAANTLAYYAGQGSIERGVEEINRFLASIGCKSTHYTNPHGLHHPDHHSCAHDLAVVSLYGMKTSELFRKIVRSSSYTKAKTNRQGPQTWLQSNRLLRPGRFYCEYATGIKTGRHMRALENIVASGEKNGRSVIVVLMHCPDRHQLFTLAKQFLEYYLNEQTVEKKIVSAGAIRLKKDIPGDLPLPLYAAQGYSYKVYPSEEPDIKVVVDWLPARLPIRKDECVGSITVFANGKEMQKIPLHAAEERRLNVASALYQGKAILTEDLPRMIREHKFMALLLAFLSVYCFFSMCKGRKSRRM